MIRVQRNLPRFNKYINFSVKSYHSFPDPNEEAVITTARAQPVKLTDKGNTQLSQSSRLDASFPGLDTLPRRANVLRPTTRSTKLPNGLTVASQDMNSLMSSFSFVVKAGSSFEVQEGESATTGATQMLELNAFHSSLKRSHQQMSDDIGNMGGFVQCISSREHILYCVDVLRNNVEAALDVLAETILQPSFPDDEIDDSKAAILFQKAELPGEILSRDVVQMAAYGDSPLGNHHFCPDDKIEHINSAMLQKFRSQHFLGENCFLVGAGIDHDHFVELVTRRFEGLPSGRGLDLIQRRGSTYVGGMRVNQRELKEPFLKIAIAFDVGGWKDEMLVPTCVLQMLLGGGSSFSAGGPGKGMYTRLYRQVLNSYHWVEAAESFVAINEDEGALGIDGSCKAEDCHGMIQVIVDQLTRLAVQPVAGEELSRAKNMLKSMLMMQLESRLVLCEDIGRQFAVYGYRETPESLCMKIDAVTALDLQKVAQRMARSAPSVGVVGEDVSHLPTYEEILHFTTEYRKQMFSQHNIIL